MLKQTTFVNRIFRRHATFSGEARRGRGSWGYGVAAAPFTATARCIAATEGAR